MTNASHSHIPTFSGAFRTNLDAMIDLFKRGDKGPAGKTIGFELERILIDRTGTPVPFEGKRGVGALLERIAKEAEASKAHRAHDYRRASAGCGLYAHNCA